MPITQYNSSVRQMSQSKFDSMKNASGKIPDLANQIVMTNSEDTNTSCLRTEVVYDMTSSDASKNWGYTSGIQGGVTVSGKDFSKYDKLMFYGYRTGIMTFCAEIDITIPTKSLNLFGRATNCFHFIESNVSYTAGMTIELNTSLTGFTAKFNQNAEDRNSNAEWFVAKIEGVLKTPSMIYTGDELTAGNGISLNNGIISQKQRCSLNISNFNYTHYSSPGWTTEGVIISGTFTKYDEASSLLISYASSSFYVTGGGSAYCKVSIDDINVEHSDIITNSSNETHSISKTVIATNISAGTHSFKWTCWADASNRKANIAAYNTYSIAIQEI